MKKLIILATIIAASIAASAQIPDGWQYDGEKASITAVDYIEYDYDTPTILHMIVGEKGGKNWVMLGLGGRHQIHDFRENQLYVMVSFDYKKPERWRIKLHETEKDKFRFFLIESADKFIARLKRANTVEVSFPLYGVGVADFWFYAHGYPLDM